nr:hypothetical protein [Tanacetum cinerariifolium]
MDGMIALKLRNYELELRGMHLCYKLSRNALGRSLRTAFKRLNDLSNISVVMGKERAPLRAQDIVAQVGELGLGDRNKLLFTNFKILGKSLDDGLALLMVDEDVVT